MRRNLGEFHDGGAVEEGNFRQTRNIRDGWAASGVQEIAIGGEVEFARLTVRTTMDLGPVKEATP